MLPRDALGLKNFFHAYVVDKSAFFLHLAFLQCAVAWKNSFLSFCSVQKHEKLRFGLSEMFRSTKNFILPFLKCSGARKTSFWPF